MTPAGRGPAPPRLRGAARRRHGGADPRHAEGGGRLRATSAPTASSPTPAGRVRSLPMAGGGGADGAAAAGGLSGAGAHRHRDLLLGTRPENRRERSSTCWRRCRAAAGGYAPAAAAVWSRAPSRRTSAAGHAKLPNLCPHFHLSLQSGCDETLRRMNRKYDTARFYRVRHAAACVFRPSRRYHRPDRAVFPARRRRNSRRTLAFIETLRLRRHAHLPLLHPPRHQGRCHGAAQRRREGGAAPPAPQRWRRQMHRAYLRGLRGAGVSGAVRAGDRTAITPVTPPTTCETGVRGGDLHNRVYRQCKNNRHQTAIC